MLKYDSSFGGLKRVAGDSERGYAVAQKKEHSNECPFDGTNQQYSE